MRVADVVFTKGGKVLLVQQRKKAAEGLWSYPGGAIEYGETVEQAIVREVKEELGVKLIDQVFLRQYSITTPRGKIIINTFTGRFVGSIKLKEDELSAYKWFSLEELRTSTELRGKVVIKQAEDALDRIKVSSFLL